MSSKELRTDLVTNSTDPFAPTRVEITPSARDAAGRAAFADLVGGGGYDSLTESGRDAFRAYGLLASDDEHKQTSKQAALDALRDAKSAGLFNADAKPGQPSVAESKDPTIRNQSPTGTVGESAGPSNQGVAPAVSPVVGEPNSTTPAVAKR